MSLVMLGQKQERVIVRCTYGAEKCPALSWQVNKIFLTNEDGMKRRPSLWHMPCREEMRGAGKGSVLLSELNRGSED